MHNHLVPHKKTQQYTQWKHSLKKMRKEIEREEREMNDRMSKEAIQRSYTIWKSKTESISFAFFSFKLHVCFHQFVTYMCVLLLVLCGTKWLYIVVVKISFSAVFLLFSSPYRLPFFPFFFLLSISSYHFSSSFHFSPFTFFVSLFPPFLSPSFFPFFSSSFYHLFTFFPLLFAAPLFSHSLSFLFHLYANEFLPYYCDIACDKGAALNKDWTKYFKRLVVFSTYCQHYFSKLHTLPLALPLVLSPSIDGCTLEIKNQMVLL